MTINRNILRIAVKQLSHKKKQTILTIAGIGVSVMVLISAISLMDGLLQNFIEKIVESAPHIIVSGEKLSNPVKDLIWEKDSTSTILFYKNVERNDEEIIKNYSRIENIVKTDSNVKEISPVLTINVIAKFGIISQPLPILGIIPSKADAITKFSESMIEGNFSELEKTPNGIIMGTTAANDFKIKVGDRINLVSNFGDIFNSEIIGIFSTGINNVDNNAYVNLRMAQNLGNYLPNEVSQLYLKLKDIKKDAETSFSIKIKTNYNSKTWEESSSSIISLYKTISTIIYFLVFFVLLVAGFGVANILITNVFEKYRDIAILKSIGFKNSEISSIYIIQGMIVALVGAVIGCLLGFIAIQILANIPVTASQTAAVRSDRLTMGKSPYYFILTTIFALIVSFFASLGPSRSAAKVNPVDILRGER